MGTIGLQIICGHCGCPFWICRSCYRGQRYCSEKCRDAGYKARRRIARKKHESSPEGRADHRDRQRKYRERKRNTKNGVTDQSIAVPTIHLNAAFETQSTFKLAASCCRCGCKLEKIWGDVNEFLRARWKKEQG